MSLSKITLLLALKEAGNKQTKTKTKQKQTTTTKKQCLKFANAFITWNRLLKNVVYALSLEAFSVRLDWPHAT